MNERGRCEVCKIKYEKEVSVGSPVFGTAGIDYNSCPRCGFNPQIKKNIRNIIYENYILKIGRYHSINGDELTDLIMEDMIKLWPKPEREK